MIVARRATTSERLALTRREATGIVGACQTRATLDSLTVHYVARELDDRWRGRRILACHGDPTARALTLWCDASEPVLFDVRALTVSEVSGEASGDLLRGWIVTSVEAPEDERRLVITCERTGKFRGSRARRGDIEISFVPSARGVRARDGTHVLTAVGSMVPPVADPRPVLDDSSLVAALGARDAAAMLRGRWMSADVCDVLLAQPRRAVELYHLILALPAAAPSRCGDVVFPIALCENAQPVPSLIPPASNAVLAPPEQPPDRATRAAARMRRELESAREAPRLRAIADALMAMGTDARVPATVRFADGSEAPVPSAAAGDTPITLAERLYKEARAMERALERLPARIAALEAGAHPVSRTPKLRASTPKKRPAERLPYRTYKSSGGLQILVGRGARANDELTYDVARADDVWLHARDVTGAHVVLRWTQDAAPPTRDLHEAAALAAWYSRARGSTVVPVDWTRRRHVRRARGGPPGRALVERAQTVMARPSAELERRLRANEE
ncbi:MAG: NFACT RNA binding domain-containing protein [Gemmatimonadaceae bacterium]